tara:strand:+ start:132 stop:308 length:177 start_codon:yes stop_codon:yes gene_type:complete
LLEVVAVDQMTLLQAAVVVVLLVVMQVIRALEEVVLVEHNLLVVRGDQVQMQEPMVVR